ncbi:MBOAT family protein [Pseudorhodobacter sp.]|uniref:MBOAT family O-acyltransferase n=1 Tax=Pseudorhodobacter sp. TaxID=1934400 RepID=UPI002AFF8350|nr:MBOAT family protein [Pseudorhodobacter sp.]
MLFSSIPFVFVFLPISLIGFFAISTIAGPKARLWWLAACSLLFYGYWRIDYLPILVGSVAVNHVLARIVQSLIAQNTMRKRRAFMALLAGITLNLVLLGYFKYTDFSIETFNAVTGFSVPTLNLVLPLAISFFTFQQITYLVDSYKGYIKRSDFLDYLVFVTFFPQLIAGPIVHHKEMMPQFQARFFGFVRWKFLLKGAMVFSIGLFKKIVIADHFATYADLGYASAEALTMAQAWITTLSYTFQLYFDFSGYSDMAIGAALMFGVRLPFNFFSPYKATSVRDFWRRWHMSLSRFLRDYVYIPLGGSRQGEARVATNLMTTFVLGGLWHGAGWTFIVWGAIHGTALIAERGLSKLRVPLPRVLKWAMTFLIVHLGWVFFRSADLAQATQMLSAMFGGAAEGTGIIASKNAARNELLLAFVAVLFFPNSIELTRNINALWKTVAAGLLFGFACIAMVASRSEVFLYFNF